MSDLKVYASILEPTAQEQIEEMANHPAFSDAKVRIMPDAHAGAGCVIGFTADLGDKVVPNLVGVDIGCGMLTVEIGESVDLQRLDDIIRESIPSGKRVNEGRVRRFPELETFHCFRNLKDTKRIERSIGTLGGGNHFIEVDVDEVGKSYLVIHTGSRNLGKQVAELYQATAIDFSCGKEELYAERERIIAEYKATGRRKEIQGALKELNESFNENSPSMPPDLAYLEGEWRDRYLHDMRLCQAFATMNRETIATRILERLVGKSLGELPHFETIHNYIGDDNIIRKGAIAAYEGQALLIPLNMRDGSIIGVGKGNEDWNKSAPHGAGRAMSRRKAKETLSMDSFKEQMSGIYSTTVCEETLDEAPDAYKPAEAILGALSPTVEVSKRIMPTYNFKATE